MNCPNCDNDLMVRLEPQGAMRFLRFLPMESYYCVKCGKRVTRLSGPSSNPALGVALMVLVLAGMALAVWRSAGDREPAKPAAVAEAPAGGTQAAAPPAPPEPAAPAAQPETPPATPPAVPAAKPEPAAKAAPAAKTVAIPTKSSPAPAKPAAPAKPEPEPAKPAAETPKATAEAAKPAAPAAKPAAETAKPAATGLRTISAVTVAVAGGSTRITVAAGSPIEGFTAFPLASPARFVLDLPGRFAYRGASTIPVSGGVVTGVRVGAYPDKIRLVLDYAKTGPDGRPAKPPMVTSTPQGLSVTAE